MISKKDRQRLIDALNTAMTLNVADEQARKNIAVAVAQGLELPFIDHFVQACVKKW